MKKILALATIFALNAHAETILHRGNGTEPQSIDPHAATGEPEFNVIYDLFEGLVGRDNAGKIVPALAESWTISEDGKTYIFKLRNAVWSDNTPITAQTFVDSWKRFLNPETAANYAFILAPVKNAARIVKGDIKDINELGVRAVDDKTVEITLENPTPYFFALLAHPTTYAVPIHIIEKYGKNWTRPENIVTSSAYVVNDWQPNAKLITVKSPTYWDKDNVKIDKVIFYPLEDSNSELNLYRSDKLDMTSNKIGDEQIKWGRENLPKELKLGPQLALYYYGFNLTKAPFKDNLKLRQALALTVNRDILTDKISGAGEIPAYSAVPSMNNYQNYTPDYAKLPYEERVKQAQQLYTEAGYSKDNPVKFELLYNTNENHKKIAIAVAAMWKKTLGAEVSLRNEEWKVFLQSRQNQNMQLYRGGWNADYDDPFTFLEIHSTASDLNNGKYSNAEFDELLKKSSQEMNPEKRAAILQSAEKIITDEVGILPLMVYSEKRFVKPYVKGYVSNPSDVHLTKYLVIEK